MTTRHRICAVTFALTALFAAAVSSCRADSAPFLWKTSIRMNCRRFERFFPTPTAKEPQYATTSWLPRFSFTIQGPLGGGSQLTITFTKPSGATWLTLPLDTPEIPEGETRLIENTEGSDEQMERKAIRDVGDFKFKITLKSELSGTNMTLYSGTFHVAKFHMGFDAKNEKNMFEYYVDHDWNLPIGYLTVDTQISEEAPRLQFVTWFRGELSSEKVAAYLFYKGKEISSTKVADEGNASTDQNVQTPGMLPDPKWERWKFEFLNAPTTHVEISANQYPDTFHWLDKNPGEYEIKVLRGGKLARTASFAVGDDGKIVDPGLSEKNHLGSPWMMVPVKIVPGSEGKAVITNYRADAYYGNAITGFPAP